MPLAPSQRALVPADGCEWQSGSRVDAGHTNSADADLYRACRRDVAFPQTATVILLPPAIDPSASSGGTPVSDEHGAGYNDGDDVSFLTGALLKF